MPAGSVISAQTTTSTLFAISSPLGVCVIISVVGPVASGDDSVVVVVEEDTVKLIREGVISKFKIEQVIGNLNDEKESK